MRKRAVTNKNPEQGGRPVSGAQPENSAFAGELRQSPEACCHALFEQSPLAIQMVAADGRTLRVNRAWEELWGVSFAALENYNLFEDRQLVEKGLLPLLEKALHGEAVLMPEVEYDRAATPEVFEQGGRIWVHTHIFPLKNLDGTVMGIVLLHEDVSGRKRMEQELAEKREQHEVAQQIAHLGHWSLDLVGDSLVWSDEVYRIFGLRPGMGNTYETFLSHVHPEDVGFVNRAYRESVEKRGTYDVEHRLLLSDGSVKWVQERCRTWYAEDGTPLRSVGTVLDISKRKQAEAALQEAMEKYQALVESSSDWVWEVDEKGAYTYASPKVEEILGYRPEDVLGKTPFDFMPADERQRMLALFAEMVRERRPFDSLENRNLHRDGHVVVLETSGVPFFDEKGELAGFRGIDRDITRRKQAEESLRESRRQNRMLIENMLDVYYQADMRGRLTFISPSCLPQTGYRPEEIIGCPVTDFYADPAQRQELLAALWQHGRVNDFTVKLVHKDGAPRFASVTCYLMLGENREPIGIEGILRNTTERIRAEQELQQLLQENRSLMRQLMRVQEEERRLLACDLHDELGQLLTSISVRADFIAKQARGPGIRTAAEEIARDTRASFEASEALLVRLRPVTLDLLGLADALRDLTGKWQKQVGIACSLSIIGDIDDLDEMRRIAIYRLVQEGLTNAFRHGHADRVEVVLRRLPKKGEIQVEIDDNGKGLRIEKIAAGMGVIGMRERVHALGGVFTLTNLPEDGVRIEAFMPLNDPEARHGG